LQKRGLGLAWWRSFVAYLYMEIPPTSSLLISEEQNLISRVLVIGVGFFEVSLRFSNQFVIVLAGDHFATWTAQMSHMPPCIEVVKKTIAQSDSD